MATFTFESTAYSVDHAVKGSDYIHCYDESGVCIASFEGIKDFSAFSYSGTYMSPDACAEEPCNGVMCVDNTLKTRGGTVLTAASIGAVGCKRGIKLANDADMDNLTTPGDYYINGSNNIKNLPYTAGGSIIEVREGGYAGTLIQKQICSSSTLCTEHTRSRTSSGAWGKWSQPVESVNGIEPYGGAISLTPYDIDNTLYDEYGGAVQFNEEYVRNTETSKPSITLRKNPFALVYFLRLYFMNNKAMEAGKPYPLLTVWDEMAPPANHALSFACSVTDASVIMKTDGTLEMRPREALPAGYSCYITGFWFYKLNPVTVT